jgi:hypothetical protein
MNDDRRRFFPAAVPMREREHVQPIGVSKETGNSQHGPAGDRLACQGNRQELFDS